MKSPKCAVQTVQSAHCAVCSAYGGGGGVSGGGGGDFGTPKFCCLVYSCRDHSPWNAQLIHKDIFWGTHWAHKIILYNTQDTQEQFCWICTSIQTDPDMQYTGTTTATQKKNVRCRPREQEMARVAHKSSGGGGGDFGTNLKNENFPLKISPAKIPPPPGLCQVLGVQWALPFPTRPVPILSPAINGGCEEGYQDNPPPPPRGIPDSPCCPIW